MQNKNDIFNILAEQYEPVNVTIGRLRMAIQYKDKERQLQLLERISKRVIDLGIIN